MKKYGFRMLSLILCLALMLPMVPRAQAQDQQTASPVLEDEVTEQQKPLAYTAAPTDGYKEISTAQELLSILDDPYGCYVLTEDIDLGHITPIGYNAETGTYTSFCGTLDGNGHVITYSMGYTFGCSLYGLFALADYAAFRNINLQVDMDLTVDSFPSDSSWGSITVGALTGSSSFYEPREILPTYDNVNVTGSITANINESYPLGGVSFGGIGGCAGTANACNVDLDVHIESFMRNDGGPYGHPVSYNGFFGNWGLSSDYSNYTRVNNCTLAGDAYISGLLGEVSLLFRATDCISTQNLEVEGVCEQWLCVDMIGTDNIIRGEFQLGALDYTAINTNCILMYCNGSSVQTEGSLLVRAGAYRCSNVTLDIGSDYLLSEDGFTGLRECHNSVFASTVVENVASFLAAMDGSNNQVFLDYRLEGIHYAVDDPAYINWIGGLWRETNSLLEGNFYFDVDTVDLRILEECTGCTYRGNVYAETFPHGWIWVARNGRNNMVFSDVTVKERTYSYEDSYDYDGLHMFLLDKEVGSYYEGTVSVSPSSPSLGRTEVRCMDSCTDCYVRADVMEPGYCTLIGGSDDCYFTGSVTSYDGPGEIFYNATGCLVEADIVVIGSDDRYCSIGTYGDTCAFSGSINILDCRGAGIYSDCPVTVHSSIVGTYVTTNIPGDGVYYHNWEGVCEEGCSRRIIYNEAEGDIRHYDRAIFVDRSGTNGNPSDSWDGNIDPIDKTYKPQRDNCSYVLHVEEMDGAPLSGGYVIFDGTQYALNESGSVTITDGPGAITPLVVAAEKDGVTREIYRVECLLPVANQINTIVIEPELDVEITLLDDNADLSASKVTGVTTEVAGKRFDWFSFDYATDLDLQLGDANIATNLNPETGRIEVVVSTAHIESGKVDSWKETWKKYTDIIESGKIPKTETKKLKFWGLEWDTSLAATMEFEYNAHTGEFSLVKGGGYVAFEGSKSTTVPFAIPAFYWTVNVGGGIEGSIHAVATFHEAVNRAITKVIGQVLIKANAEGALGMGVQAADIYAEAGLQGELSGGITFPFKSARESLSSQFTGSVFVDLRVWALGGRHSWQFADLQFWPNPEAVVLNATEDMEMSLLSRDYVNQMAAYSLRSAPVFSSAVADEQGDYPYSEIAVRQLYNGNYLLVYTDDDITRAAADRSVLRAAIGVPDGETGEILWGESVTLDDDGTGDYNFNVCVYGNMAAIVWQDMNTTFGDGEGLTTGEMAKHVELSQVVLSCGNDVVEITEQAALTQNNEVCESSAFVYYDGGEPRTFWVTSTENDPMVVGDQEVFTLWLNGEALTTSTRPITAVAVLGNELLWTTQTETANDLWQMASNGTITQVKTDNVMNLQSKGNWFCYTEGESLYVGQKTLASAMEQYIDPACTGTVLLSDDAQVYFLENGLESAQLSVLRDDKIRPVAQMEGFASCVDISDAQIVSLVKRGFATEDTADDAAYLLCDPEDGIYDLDVGEVYCEDTEVTPGGDVKLSTKLTNYGTSAVYGVHVDVTAQDGTALLSEDVFVGGLETGLDTGDSTVLSFSFTVPDLFMPQDVTVTIDGNAQTVHLGRTNLSVEASWSQLEPGMMTVTLTNTGVDYATGTLTVTDGTQVLLTEDVEIFGGVGGYDFEVPFNQYYPEETVITATVTENDPAADDWDNEASVTVVYRPKEPVSISMKDLLLEAGQTAALEHKLFPADAAMPDLTYTSSDPEVATVDSQGNVTALSGGEAEITATTPSGKRFSCAVSVTGETEKPPVVFTDVQPDAFYYDAVQWAVKNGITSGKTATTFAPTEPCTRAQVVTFLWRAAGEPEPQSMENKFPDVADGKYFTKAVLWAAEQGITGGYKDGTFGPNNTCTRDQIVTFLWRYMGKPEPVSMENIFPDVEEGKFYTKAVLWTAEQGITGGYTDGTFRPTSLCRRDQIVTFLYRAMV